jgi:hypothetical protein
MNQSVRFSQPNVLRLPGWAIVVVAMLLLPLAAQAQNVTNGTLTGVVEDQQGGVLPGATVTAVHTPTGTRYEGVTQTDGRFSLLNVRVGGPYEITVALSGFRTADIKDITVTLGESTEVPVKLQLELTESVQVTAEVSPVFTASKTGSTDTVPTHVLETLPTINRSLQDFARISPSFVQYSFNADSPALSIAGNNTRYNNIQIDGAVNNDLFSIGASGGTPGATTTATARSIRPRSWPPRSTSAPSPRSSPAHAW